MSMKIGAIVLAIVCLAALAEASPFKGKLDMCQMCQSSIDKLKSSVDVKAWKEKIEPLCGFLGDENKVKQCYKMIDEFSDLIENKTSKEFCQALKLCPTA